MSPLIIFEGLDASGKTTIIHELIKKNPQFIYSKGIGSNTFIGKISKKFPSTLLFFLEIIYTQHKIIIPNLRKNKVILRDRYSLSILSHEKAQKPLNKIISQIFRLFILKPDVLIYLTVSMDERINRLKKHKITNIINYL